MDISGTLYSQVRLEPAAPLWGGVGSSKVWPSSSACMMIGSDCRILCEHMHKVTNSELKVFPRNQSIKCSTYTLIYTFLVLTSLFTYGVWKAGTSGVEGRISGRLGDSGSSLPWASEEQWLFAFLILNPGVQNTGGSGDSKLFAEDNKNNFIWGDSKTCFVSVLSLILWEEDGGFFCKFINSIM